MKLIDALADEVRASSAYNSNIQAAPSVILWTDKLRQWESALPLLQAAMPELVVFGEYAPEKRQGPAIWLKCVIENALPEFELPQDRPPIIYLPGVERRDLRAIASCPDHLKPLAELQYRGCWWIYSNSGRDWTVNAFLVSANGGVGLDVARDDNTQSAMLKVLPEILESEREDLTNRRLEAPDFNKLVSSDPVRDLLSWMNDPSKARERWDEKRWETLSGIWETEYHFSPDRDGVLVAAELLCQRQSTWDGVWQRYEDTCHHYPDLPQLLMKVEPDLAADGSSYPVINDSEEQRLEQEFQGLLKLGPDEVRNRILRLEKQHGERRGWIWYGLDMSPLAGVLKPLSRVSELTLKTYSGISVEEMGEQFRETYWQADNQVLEALAFSLKPGHQDLVQNLLALVYTPWLDEVTRSFQMLVKTKGYADETVAKEATASYQVGGELVFFVDGLRFDIAHRLNDRLQSLGEVSLGHDWAALPSVTATAKAAITPVHDRIAGRASDKDFQPGLKDDDKPFSSHYLKKYLGDKGWEFLSEGETGNPSGNAWVQSGDIDKEGHVKQLKLAARINQLLGEVVERVEELLAAGWKKIRIVTDHGWMLTPDTMAKVDLPKYLTETRWSRCALLKESVDSGFLQVPWYWNHDVSIAMAPGARSFKAGQHYDHGGLSLQECHTPVIEIVNTQVPSAAGSVTATITDIRWLGLVCKIKGDTESDSVVAVLRTHPGDPASEISKRKPLKDGRCSLMLDDQYEQASAVLVLLDDKDNVLAKKPTLVGDE